MRNDKTIWLVLALLACLGCGDKVRVHGTVSFPDGKPLDTGMVCFQGNSIYARGTLDQKGHYRLSTLKPNDGIPPGNYRIYISGAAMLPPDPNYDPEKTSIEKPPIDLIDQKYMTPHTSEITCEVTSDMKLPFDIQVDYPTKASKRR